MICCLVRVKCCLENVLLGLLIWGITGVKMLFCWFLWFNANYKMFENHADLGVHRV